MELIAELAGWVLSWGESPFSWVALFLVSFWDSSFLPVPPDGLMIILILADPRLALPIAALASIGSLLGAALGYWIGLRGGRPLVRRLINERRIRYVERKYQENDILAIMLACFTPLPYKVFAVGAGVCQINFRRFMLASAVGRSTRFLAVGLALFFFGDQIRELMEDYPAPIAIAFLVIFAVGLFVMRWISDRATAPV